ncbi:MAG: PAS domain-containing protein, partial [SAR324 cluster bacterium]|nr:PAS domain-containing protein [SAR324 cluster bacterium]
IINSISHPFHVIEVKTKIIKQASNETGEDAVGKTCHSATHNSPIPCNTNEHPCPIEVILKTKKPTVVEHTHFKSDGTKRLIEIHASPLFDDNGEVEFIVESNFDITERR